MKLRHLRLRSTRTLEILRIAALVLVAAVVGGCASRPPSTERAACLNYRTSSELNDSSSIVLILVGVTNPEAFRSASPRELLSEKPPGTEGKATTVVVTPGESGSERVMIERLSKRLGVIADYRNRTGESRISADLPIWCLWPRPSIDLLKDTIDE